MHLNFEKLNVSFSLVNSNLFAINSKYNMWQADTETHKTDEKKIVLLVF